MASICRVTDCSLESSLEVPDLDEKVIRLLNNSEEALSMEEVDFPLPYLIFPSPGRESSLAFKLFLEHHNHCWNLMMSFVEISLSSQTGVCTDESCTRPPFSPLLFLRFIFRFEIRGVTETRHRMAGVSYSVLISREV